MAFDCVQAYLQLLYAQAVQRIREQALVQAESILRDTRVRFANGAADREAVLRADVEVSQAQEEVVSGRQLLAEGQAAINLVLGRATGLIVGGLLSGTPKTYVKTADSGNKREHAFCPNCAARILPSAPRWPKPPKSASTRPA